MSDIFLSDVHLRLDRPERASRLVRVVGRLGPGDRIFIVGDLCDFWFASRQTRANSAKCEGLRSLREFRDRGGELILLPGNHDHLLAKFYEQELGVGFAGEVLDIVSGNLRVHLVHGHLVGARKAWKALMEGPGFLNFFASIPAPIAAGLEAILDWNNERNLAETERKHSVIYRQIANSLASSADLVVFGHMHTPQDDREGKPRLIVLGGWHKRASYLRIDGEVVETIFEEDADYAPPKYADRT